jgi:HEAT repeat protein
MKRRTTWIVVTAILSCGLLAGCDGGLSGSTPDEKAVAAAKLGQTRANENIPVLVDAVRNEHQRVQLQAIDALGKIGTPEAVAALAQFQDHEARIVRSAVVQALREVLPESYPQAAEVIEAMGRDALPREDGSDPNREVRQAAVTALAVLKQPSSLDFLLDRLQHDTVEGIRNAAVQTVGDLNDARAVEVLKTVYRTDNQKNRAWAIESLGKIGDRSALPVIEEALDSYDPITRGKAAWALMKIEGEAAVPRLEQALQSESDDMPAVVMAHALALLGKQEAVPFLEDRVLHARSPLARAEAARVLGEVGRPESLEALDKAFREDRDGLVKREAGRSARALLSRFPRVDETS